MKKLKICGSIIMVIALICCTSFSSLADSSSDRGSNVTAESTVVNYIDMRGVLLRNSCNLGQHLISPSSAFSDINMVDSVDSVNQERARGFENYILSNDLNLLSVEVSSNGFEVLEQDSDSYIVKVYERTDFEWYNTPEKTPIHSAFGTWHEITLERDWKSGGFLIVKDEFNEEDITGINTIEEEDREELIDLPVVLPGRTNASTGSVVYGSYIPEQIQEYCRKYAFSYNPNYYDYSVYGGDCANFASQCLANGGLAQYRGSTQYDGWYYDKNGTYDITYDDISASAWRGALVFLPELSSHYASEMGSVSDGDVNWNVGDLGLVSRTSSGQGHVYICSGKSGSVGLFSSHTEDRYNVVEPETIDTYLHIHSCIYNNGAYRCLSPGCGFVS